MSPPITAEEYFQDTSFRRGVLNLREYVICGEFPNVDNWIPIAGEPEWLGEGIEKLEKFKDLEPNWNSYDSLSIDHDLILQGKALLKSISISGISEPFLAPVSDGGINIEWNTAERFLSIKIRKKGVRFFYINRQDKADKQGGEIEIDEGLDSILKLLF